MLSITTASSKEVIRLDQGEIAPFSGNLIKTERLVQYYKNNQRLDVALLRVDLYKSRLRKTEDELSKVTLKGYMGTVLGFTLGVVITGIAAKAALESTR